MRERPILFSGEMVRAILEGRKTQTRRVAKVHDAHVAGMISPNGSNAARSPKEHVSYCPYGKPGDRLWVRETLRTHRCFGFPLGQSPQVNPAGERIWSYAADNLPDPTGSRPSIHMPRWASRLTLELTEVRVERVQDIREEDAKAEGCQEAYDEPFELGSAARRENEKNGYFPPSSYTSGYAALWDQINAKRDGGIYAWEKNPWVWVLEFKRVEL